MRRIAESFSPQQTPLSSAWETLEEDNCRIHPPSLHHQQQHVPSKDMAMNMDMDIGCPQPTEQQQTLKKSVPIHIQNFVHRTPSEIQLREDEMVADIRDYCMFQRIVNGMTNPNARTPNQAYHNDPIVQRIIQTRAHPVSTGGPATEAMMYQQQELSLGGKRDTNFGAAWNLESSSVGLAYPSPDPNAGGYQTHDAYTSCNHMANGMDTSPAPASRNNSGVFLFEDL